MATVDLSWTDNSSNEDGFRVYRSTSSSPSFPDDYSEIDTVGANTTTYSDTSAPDGDTVFYAVTAFNSTVESSETTTSIEVDLPAPTLSTPSLDADNNILIVWSVEDNSLDGGIEVERSSDGGSTWETIVSGLGPSETAYTDVEVLNGTVDYRVRRYTDSASATSGIETLSFRPDSLTVADASIRGELTLDWANTYAHLAYNVYQAESSGAVTSDYTRVGDVPAPPFSIGGLEDGERYYHRVTSHLTPPQTQTWQVNNDIGSFFNTTFTRPLPSEGVIFVIGPDSNHYHFDIVDGSMTSLGYSSDGSADCVDFDEKHVYLSENAIPGFKVDMRTGETVYAVSMPGVGATAIAAGASYDAIGDRDTNVRLVTTADGSEQWTATPTSSTDLTGWIDALQVTANYVAVGVRDSGACAVLNKSDGSVAWSDTWDVDGGVPRETMSDFTLIADGSNGVVFVVRSYSDGTEDVAGYDITDGTEVWTYPNSPTADGVRINSPADGTLIVRRGGSYLKYDLNGTAVSKAWSQTIADLGGTRHFVIDTETGFLFDGSQFVTTADQTYRGAIALSTPNPPANMPLNYSYNGGYASLIDRGGVVTMAGPK